MIRFHCSRNDAHIADHAAINIKDGIKHQRAQRFVCRRLRRRNARHNCLENFIDADPHLGARFDCFLGRDGKDFFQLASDRGNVSVWQIDLVDDQNNRQPLFVSEMNVCHSLRFDALRGVHD